MSTHTLYLYKSDSFRQNSAEQGRFPQREYEKHERENPGSDICLFVCWFHFFSSLICWFLSTFIRFIQNLKILAKNVFITCSLLINFLDIYINAKYKNISWELIGMKQTALEREFHTFFLIICMSRNLIWTSAYICLVLPDRLTYYIAQLLMMVNTATSNYRQYHVMSKRYYQLDSWLFVCLFACFSSYIWHYFLIQLLMQLILVSYFPEFLIFKNN